VFHGSGFVDDELKHDSTFGAGFRARISPCRVEIMHGQQELDISSSSIPFSRVLGQIRGSLGEQFPWRQDLGPAYYSGTAGTAPEVTKSAE
jgi:hypothetical protein